MKAPPFLRLSANHLDIGWNLDRTLWICFGHHAWAEAKQRSSFQLIAVLPPGSNISDFDWSLAAKFPALVMIHCAGGCGDELVDELAQTLIKAGCTRVLGDYTIGDGLGERWLAQGVGHAA